MVSTLQILHVDLPNSRKNIVMKIWPVSDIHIVCQHLQALPHWVRILTFVLWVALSLVVREGRANAHLCVRSDSQSKQRDMKRVQKKPQRSTISVIPETFSYVDRFGSMCALNIKK